MSNEQNYVAVQGDDGWTEIVGEQTRGGAMVVGRGGNYDVLGEMLQANPEYMKYAASRAANASPILQRKPLQKARDWDLSFGPVSGAAGTTTVIVVQPQCLFRGEKLMANDTASPAGTGTRITQVLIGQRLQRPATGGGTLSLFFANGTLGNGVKWDTCQQALSISMTVSFVSACTFDAVVFGKAVI